MESRIAAAGLSYEDVGASAQRTPPRDKTAHHYDARDHRNVSYYGPIEEPSILGDDEGNDETGNPVLVRVVAEGEDPVKHGWTASIYKKHREPGGGWIKVFENDHPVTIVDGEGVWDVYTIH